MCRIRYRLRCDCLGEELHFTDFVKVVTLSLHRYGRKTASGGGARRAVGQAEVDPRGAGGPEGR